MSRSGGAGLALRRGTGLAAILLLAGCAKVEAPPGALPDTRPPQVARVEPADDSVVPGFDGDLHIVFDEPINTPQDLSRTLQGSPAYRYEVSNGFSDLKIHPDGGWRAGVVYVIQLPAGIPDLLGNRTASPIRTVFSTGPPITETSVSGTLLDRVTGQGVQGARVLFEQPPDTIPYTAVSDTGGIFSLSSLPTGRYWAYGFRDLNGDMRLQRRLEPYDSATFDLPDSTSTARLTLRLTDPDSTPPRLLVALAVDSVTVELRFDDYLDPNQDFDSLRVAIHDTLTGTSWPVTNVAPETQGGPLPTGGSRVPAVAVPARPDTTAPAREDTTAAARPGTPPPVPADTAGRAPRDTTPADTSGRTPADSTRGLSPDTALSRADSAGRRGGSSEASAASLPVQKLLARLGRPLTPGAYRITVSSVRNLRGLSAGGDTVFVFPASDTAGRPGGGR